MNVLETVEALYRALSDGDVEWFERHTIRTSIYVGVGSAYWMTGTALLAELHRQFKEQSMQWTTDVVLINEIGDVAWVLDRPVIHFDDGSEMQCRSTMVFLRNDQIWQLTHSHLSVGAD